MTGSKHGPGEVLAAWASELLGAERAAAVASSLAERAGHLEQLRRAPLRYDDEPATQFTPDPQEGPARGEGDPGEEAPTPEEGCAEEGDR
jgi:hypothetical protein